MALTQLSRGSLQLSDGLFRCPVLKAGWGPGTAGSRCAPSHGLGVVLGLEAQQGLHLVLRQPRGLELGGSGNSRLYSRCPGTSSTRSWMCLRMARQLTLKDRTLSASQPRFWGAAPPGSSGPH